MRRWGGFEGGGEREREEGGGVAGGGGRGGVEKNLHSLSLSLSLTCFCLFTRLFWNHRFIPFFSSRVAK